MFNDDDLFIFFLIHVCIFLFCFLLVPARAISHFSYKAIQRSYIYIYIYIYVHVWSEAKQKRRLSIIPYLTKVSQIKFYSPPKKFSHLFPKKCKFYPKNLLILALLYVELKYSSDIIFVIF